MPGLPNGRALHRLAITYNVSYAIFGGTAPFVTTWLIAATGNELPPAIYLTAIAAGALIAASLLRERNSRSFTEEDAAAAGAEAPGLPQQMHGEAQ